METSMEHDGVRGADNSLISHVSDTAKWVALHRAMESERKDALFHDAYARSLAGMKGEKIAAGLKYGKSSAWSTIVRTAVYDEFLERCIMREGVDTVVNIAAGLDSRPYRLKLPKILKWIEIDLPDILSYVGMIIRCSEGTLKLSLLS